MIMTSMATAACTAGCCKLEPMDSYKTTDRISWVAVRFYSLELLKLGSAPITAGLEKTGKRGFGERSCKLHGIQLCHLRHLLRELSEA